MRPPSSSPDPAANPLPAALPPEGRLDANTPVDKLPGHWLLASLGKRVLRPGGVELTRELLAALAIGPEDRVVEFAPGLGLTARLTLARNPRSYLAVERDPAAAALVERGLGPGPERRCLVGSAERTGLPAASATVVYGEAMLSMQSDEAKAQIVAEAARLLAPGGRYGIHELCVHAPGADESRLREIRAGLSREVHAGIRLLTLAEWRELLESAGLEVVWQRLAPMHLLEPARVIRDEGLWRALRFAWNVARHPAARQRVWAMRQVFRKYRHDLSAVSLVAKRPAD